VLAVGKKINYVLYKLRFIKDICSKERRLYLVKSLVIPHILYCDIIYHCCDSFTFRFLQVSYNNCLRYIYGLRKYDHVSPYSNNIFGCSLRVNFQLRMVLFLYNVLKNQSPLYLFNKIKFVESVRTRQIVLPRVRTNIYHNSVLYNCFVLWNKLPVQIRSLNSFMLFKKQSLEFLMSV